MNDTNTKGRNPQASSGEGRGSGSGRGGGSGGRGGSGSRQSGGGGRSSGGGRQPGNGGRQSASHERTSAGDRTSTGEREPVNGNRQAPAPMSARTETPAPVAQAQPAPRPAPTKVPSQHKDLLFQKVAIFVDAENIEMSSLKHHEGRTDYKKILEHVGDREIVRILYYKPIYKEISAEFQAFWSSLGGEIKRPNKNADTFLVIDAVTMAEKLDVAIILGGDKDFLPLMWYLRSRGCKVEIWSWPETTSPEMKEAADYYHPLTEEFVIKSRR